RDVIAVVTGIVQGFAVIPGVSRSGSTFFTLSLGAFDPREILLYSYMLSMPVTAAAAGYLVLTEPLLFRAWPALLASFLVGVAMLRVLMRYSRRIDYVPFLLAMGTLSILGGVLV
ncbi:MAG: undecaprenyl-diphosphate phosphatase, partial [Halobacteriaceae archaeon]